jgi:predicted nuclease of predicted toxin-antitoxin system
VKLLFDENLHASLVELLAEAFPQCASVTALGLGQRPDEEIVIYAKAIGFVIVTKDVHFYRHCVARGYPPKVVWVRTGNCTIRQLFAAFQKARQRIEDFEINDEPSLLSG